MVESKKRNQTAISKQQKQQKVLKKAKKVAAPVIVEPVIEEPIIEQEEEEEEVAQIEEEEEQDEDENKIAFNNDNEEEEEVDQDDQEMQSDNEEEVEEEKVEKSIRSKSNDELLCARFISTMAATFTKQLQGKNTHVSALRGLYFESINQIKHESIRELLFKPSSWHKFYRIVRKIIKNKNAEIQDDENKEEQEEADEEEQEEEQEEVEEEEDVISNVIFKNLLSYQVIGGRESLIQQIQDNESTSTDKINHLYKQSISIDSKQSNKYTSIINSFFTASTLPTHELLDKFIMYSLTLGEATNEIIDILNLILDSASTNDSNNNAKIYKSLRQFLSISILEKLYKESSKVGMIKSNVMLATQLFKFSLLNSSTTSNEYMESDYSTIKLLLGKTGFLPKLVSLMTSFDFTLDQYNNNNNNNNSKNNNNFISILLKQFIKESQLSTPPTNSISYLKSRILCERGIVVLTKLKDPLLTKLKISSATLPIPESLLNFFNSNQELLVKTHKSMDNNQAIRLLKLNSLVDILAKVQEIERKSNEQDDDDEEDQDNEDYVDDHFTINKNGNASEQVEKELPKESNEDEDEEQTEKELEESIENMEGTKSLLDFLDEDDLKSDDEDDQE